MKKMLQVVGLLVLIVGICAIPFILDEGLRRNVTEKWDEFMWDYQAPAADEASQAILSYLAQPHFAGSRLETQVLGEEVRLALLDQGNSRAYFISEMDDGELEGLALNAGKFLHPEAKLMVLQEEDGKHVLTYDDAGKPETWLRWNPQREYLFYVHPNAFRVSSDASYSFGWSGVEWTVSAQELLRFWNNEVTYGGPIFAEIRERGSGVRKTSVGFARHMSYVGKSEESLTRLTTVLTSDADAARERRIQALVDFVTRDIAYDHREARMGSEVLKRPNEVLMSAKSDCSGKTILLASLLEQIGEEYLLCHFPQHVTIAVPRGGFSTSNGLSFNYEGLEWVLCETSFDGRFAVGITRVRGSQGSNPQYLELRDGRVLEFSSGRELRLL